MSSTGLFGCFGIRHLNICQRMYNASTYILQVSEKTIILLIQSSYLHAMDSIGIFREGQRAYYLTHGAMALKNTKGNISVPKTISYILARLSIFCQSKRICYQLVILMKSRLFLAILVMMYCIISSMEMAILRS